MEYVYSALLLHSAGKAVDEAGVKSNRSNRQHSRYLKDKSFSGFIERCKYR